MKNFLIVILIVALVGFFTVPSQQKFNDYLAKKGKDIGKCPGGTRHESYKVFSLDYVDYCEPPVDLQNLQPLISKPSHTDKYIGLFGMFFKL